MLACDWPHSTPSYGSNHFTWLLPLPDLGTRQGSLCCPWAQVWRLFSPPLDGGLPSQPEEWEAGEKACCPNCRLGHHAWNLGCPARPTAGGDPSCSRNGLHVKRACSKLAAPQLTPRPVLLREKALPDTPPLPRCREVQEARCGVPPKRQRRRSGRKKATTTTTSGTQTAAPVTCSVGTQAAAPRSGGVATQTPSPPTPESEPPPPPAAGGESSPPSSNLSTQPDGETPKDLDLDEAFLVQPKEKKKKGEPDCSNNADVGRTLC
ncbi:hypothetical protein Pcinc_000811 [Petrolisthes cinctipes]|uniref:Uncharacterized protein n=1 Tax=Petrolisthes cinctipes TaxID=88211 RepID=A0AAE1GM28_PETCI|nr:hypothetical protein Pcinc_000811 [Petrolisthes cinctipes]